MIIQRCCLALCGFLAGCGTSYEVRISTSSVREGQQALAAFDSTAHHFHAVSASDSTVLRRYNFPFHAEASATSQSATVFQANLRQYGYWTDYEDRRQFRQLASAVEADLAGQFGAGRVSMRRQDHYDSDPMQLFGIIPLAP